MELKDAVDKLREALKEDEGYYYGWQANIAMAYQDEAYRMGSRDSRETLHKIGNGAAKNFLNLLIKDTNDES